MIMPMPFYIAGGFVVTVGDVDITVGSGGAGFGYTSTLGSKANDNLISVNGTIYPVDQLRTAAGTNTFEMSFDSNEMAQAVKDHLTANYTSLQDSPVTWSIAVSDISVSLTDLLASFVSSSNVWDAGDVGNTYTMGWV